MKQIVFFFCVKRVCREDDAHFFDVARGSTHPRHFFLLNDLLIVTKPEKHKYLLRQVINLETARLKDIPDGALGSQALNAVEVHTPEASFCYLCASAEQKQQLVKKLTELMQSK